MWMGHQAVTLNPKNAKIVEHKWTLTAAKREGDS
jgi:hypothetical protein